MLQSECNGYVCKSATDYSSLYEFLTPVTKNSTASVEEANQRRLKRYTKTLPNLVCYKNDIIIAACIYRHTLYGIELIHMWVSPIYRVSYGSGLINHTLINVIGDGKDIRLYSTDTSSFKDVVEPFGKYNQYRIIDRARIGLNRMMKNKVVWKEV